MAQLTMQEKEGRMRRRVLVGVSSLAAATAVYIGVTAGQGAAPNVTWTVPTNGATVKGLINEKLANGRVTVDQAVDRVDFYVDGNPTINNTERFAPYSLVWDTRTVNDGTHNLRAVATTTDGSTGAAQITVTVDNIPDDIPPPPPEGDGYPTIPLPVTFDGDFDSGCSLFSGQGSWPIDHVGSDRPGNGEIDRNRVGEGSCSAHLWASGSHRTEVARSEFGSNPTLVYEELFYVPSSSGYLGYMNQHKQGGSAGGCANGGLSNRSGSNLEVSTRATCSSETRRLPIGTYPRDRWFAVMIEFKLANAGYVKAWVDPDGPGPLDYALRLPATAADTQTGDSPRVKLRQGSYGDQNVNFNIDGFRMDCISGC